MRTTTLVYGIALALIAVGCQSAPTKDGSEPSATQPKESKAAPTPTPANPSATDSSLVGTWNDDFTGQMKKVHDDVIKSGKTFETHMTIDAKMHFTYTESLMSKTQKDEGTAKLEGDKLTLTSSKAGGTAPKEWKLSGEYLYLLPDGEKNGVRLKK